MTSLLFIALGAALATLAAYGHERWLTRPHRSAGATTVEDVMSVDVPAVSAQLTVEEVTHGTLGPADRPAWAVTDAQGHAVGVVLPEDLARIPHTERPARLVGEVARLAVVDRRADLAEALERPGLVAAGTAVVVDRRRQPVGLLRVREAAERISVVPDGPLPVGEDGYGPGVRAPADVPQTP